MLQERRERYRQKMQTLMTKIESIPENRENETEVNATLYCVQVAIDAAMDIIAMLVKDKGHEVSDDYHNIEFLGKRKVVSLQLSEELKRLNGLRNAIVHKYNTFEEEIVIKNVPSIQSTLEAFLEIVERNLHDAATKDKGRA